MFGDFHPHFSSVMIWRWNHQIPQQFTAEQLFFPIIPDSGWNQSLLQNNEPSFPGWWLNQPIWKIWSSNWIISPRIRGENKNMFQTTSQFPCIINSIFIHKGRPKDPNPQGHYPSSQNSVVQTGKNGCIPSRRSLPFKIGAIFYWTRDFSLPVVVTFPFKMEVFQVEFLLFCKLVEG